MKKLLKLNLPTFVFYYREIGSSLFLCVIINIVVGVLDGFGLMMFIPLLETISNPSDVSSTNPISKAVESLGLNLTLANALIFLVVLFSIKGLIKYFSDVFQVKIYQLFISTLRIKLIQRFNKISFKFYSSADVGKIQNSFTGEIGNVITSCSSFLKVIEASVLVLTYVSLAFFTNPKFTLLVILASASTNFIYKILNDRVKKESRILVKKKHFFQGLLIQYVNLFKYLKASGKINTYSDKLERSTVTIEKTNVVMGKLKAMLNSIREPLMILILSIVIFVQVFVLKGSLELILVSILFFYRALQSLLMMQNQLNNFYAQQGSLDNLKDFQKELDKNKRHNGEILFSGFQEKIQLKSVFFNYGEVNILRDINFSIHKNETIALVGESGSGKSTLINILSGLLPIDKGDILIDGQAFDTLNISSLQQFIGYITQETIVFDDTIYNNITFWDKKTPENLKRFYESLEAAALLEIVAKYDSKEETRLGNNGISLSGGQRQRISIARELYKNPQILFMDEATSSLDSESENHIQQSTEKLKGNITLIIAAHRLSTIRNADKVIFMQKGEIKSIGTFSELIEIEPSFKKAVELQSLQS